MFELAHGHLYGVELETGLCRYPDAIWGYFASWAICADGQPDELIRVSVS